MGYLVYLVNFALGITIIWLEYASASDKSVIVSIPAYLILIVINFVLGIVGNLDKGTWARYFLRSALGLIVVALVYLVIPWQEIIVL